MRNFELNSVLQTFISHLLHATQRRTSRDLMTLTSDFLNVKAIVAAVFVDLGTILISFEYITTTYFQLCHIKCLYFTTFTKLDF